MRRNHRVMLLSTILALIPFFILSFRVGGQLYRNQQRMDHFSFHDEMEQYQRKIPMEQMDLLEYDRYLEIPQTAVGIKVQNTIELPVKVQYFAEHNGKKNLALEIPKGASVLWIPTEQLGDLSLGYGLRGYPTYDKGWRYVRPFLLPTDQTDIKQLPYYYVKTEVLEAVAKKVIHSTEPMANAMRTQGVTIDKAVFTYTRFIDQIFYDKGVFCSADLLGRVWHWVDTVLLCIAIGIPLSAWLLPLWLRTNP